MQEVESMNALCIVENTTKPFEDHFAIQDVTIHAAHSR